MTYFVTGAAGFIGSNLVDRLLAMGYHFPFPALGHVVKQGHAYRWVPIQWVW